MSIIDRVFDDIENRRERILSGKINCIPWNFPRFEEFNPGIEKSKYYLITASSKVNYVIYCLIYNAAYCNGNITYVHLNIGETLT